LNIEYKLSSTQKVLIGILILGMIVSILLIFKDIQSIIILIVEKAKQRPLENPAKAYISLQKTAPFGVFSCALLIGVVLFFKQLISAADSILNKVLVKRFCGITVKEILIRQPFLLIFFMFVLYFIKNIFLVINIIGFDGLIIILALLVHISVSLFVYRNNDKSIIPILTCYFLLFLSLLLNSFTFDYSIDGQTYHQTAVIQLRNGWNPFFNNLPNNPVFVWIYHYPRFTEMFASIFLSVFNNIELGKSYNMILFIVVFLYAIKCTNKFHSNKLIVTAIAVIFAANPVVFAQFFTYCVDGVVGMLVVILILACMEYEKNQNITDLFIIIAVSVFSINTKFNGFICGFVLIAYVIKQFAAKEYKKMFVLICAGFAILIIGVLFIGYNPYIMNTRDFGHPFYPLFGEGKIDIITVQMTKEFTFGGFNSMHPIKRFFSLFFMDYTLKYVPFNIYKLTTLPFRYLDIDPQIRIGGFGVLFTEIYILLFLILFFSIKNKNIVNYKKLLFPMIILLFITIVMPENWWARYIPFFWYLIGFFAMAGDFKSMLNKKLLLACLVLVIINSGVFLFSKTLISIRCKKAFKSVLMEMKASDYNKIYIVVDTDDIHYSIDEKLKYYNLHKNIIYIEDKDRKYTTYIPYTFIKKILYENEQ